MKKQKLFVRIVCIVLVVLMAVSVGAVAITAFSANAAQSTEEVSASVSAGASGYINASYVNLRSGTQNLLLLTESSITQSGIILSLNQIQRQAMLQRNMLP